MTNATASPARAATPHPTETAAYWRALARNERALAKNDRGVRGISVESFVIRERNAKDYDARADEIERAAAAAQEVARVASQPARVNALNLGLAAAETETVETWCSEHGDELHFCSPRRCEAPDEHYVSPFDDAIDDLPPDLRRVALNAQRAERLRRERAAAAEARDDDRRSRGEEG